jgi:hypothetical protein
MLAAKTPLAEVLTVVGQQPVAVLAYPGARALDHLWTLEARKRMRIDPHRSAACESNKRDLFDWSPVQPNCESCVVHDVAVAHVDSVMQIASAGCNEVRAQRRFLTLQR